MTFLAHTQGIIFKNNKKKRERERERERERISIAQENTKLVDWVIKMQALGHPISLVV
jgi:hypothetical protein